MWEMKQVGDTPVANSSRPKQPETPSFVVSNRAAESKSLMRGGPIL